jgi:hypothetical protein
MGRNCALAANQQYTQEGIVGDWYITHGFALACGSLNAFGTTTDDVVSAETAYKVKERFIKQFGPPLYTSGIGTSGGSMQQQLIANAYPGILDGIIPNRQYADAMTFNLPQFDCELLVNVFKDTMYTREQMEAVAGNYWGYCVSNAARYPNQRAQNCDAAVLAMIMATPTIKSEDVRCTFQDDLKQVFGTDPVTGFGLSPWDNVGVQEGLVALNDGVITFDQFLDINRRIGGHNIDGAITPNRQVGNPQALQAAYETGRMNLMTGGMPMVPYLNIRTYTEADWNSRGDANVDVHDTFHSLIIEARANKYLGPNNSVVNLYAASGIMNGAGPGTPQTTMNLYAAQKMDEWLTALMLDTSSRPAAVKLAAAKPADLVDSCWTAGGRPWFENAMTRGAVERVTDFARCNEIFESYTNARVAAGGPIATDVLKCQLKPVSAADYRVAPTAAQLEALRQVFPEGVCDWSKPSVGMTAMVPWTYFEGDGVYYPSSEYASHFAI